MSENSIPDQSLPCHMPGYMDPCPACPLSSCRYGSGMPGASAYDRRSACILPEDEYTEEITEYPEEVYPDD